MEEVDVRQLLIRITIINWFIDLFRSNPELIFTYNDWLDEINEWFLSDVCALEGCGNSLLGYPSHAFYC